MSRASGPRAWPVRPHRGILSGWGVSRADGARRHGGIDLGALPGDAIVAMDDGVVPHRVSAFQIGAGLQAVAIRHSDADYLYTEIKLREGLAAGQRVQRGEQIGTATKNGDGNSMLPLEAWTAGKAPRGFVPWIAGDPPPAGMLDVGAIVATITPP
ncbi:MAG: peptidoglycan DD-metalloendopeptidase family protein [Deltaproteobacteria bacterium]|nr:peptidoglycan DD-metalloendopeptidase family protein [Deltaproteobacteria bacterium]